MSDPDKFILDAETTMAQASEQLSAKNLTSVLVCQGSTLLGGLSVEDCMKAEQGGRLDVSVKSYANRRIKTIAPSASCREAVALMAGAKENILPVVDDKELTGVVTQGDLLLQVYEF